MAAGKGPSFEANNEVAGLTGTPAVKEALGVVARRHASITSVRLRLETGKQNC